MTWSHGYDTLIGPRADAVSGGQQQRICIARALAANPEVLVLDEPTSSLDPQSESLLQQSLLGLKGEITLFIVAHRISTLDMCDRVMVIPNGRLEAFDTINNSSKRTRTTGTPLRSPPVCRHSLALTGSSLLGVAVSQRGLVVRPDPPRASRLRGGGDCRYNVDRVSLPPTLGCAITSTTTTPGPAFEAAPPDHRRATSPLPPFPSGRDRLAPQPFVTALILRGTCDAVQPSAAPRSCNFEAPLKRSAIRANSI